MKKLLVIMSILCASIITSTVIAATPDLQSDNLTAAIDKLDASTIKPSEFEKFLKDNILVDALNMNSSELELIRNDGEFDSLSADGDSIKLKYIVSIKQDVDAFSATGYVYENHYIVCKVGQSNADKLLKVYNNGRYSASYQNKQFNRVFGSLSIVLAALLIALVTVPNRFR